MVSVMIIMLFFCAGTYNDDAKAIVGKTAVLSATIKAAAPKYVTVLFFTPHTPVKINKHAWQLH